MENNMRAFFRLTHYEKIIEVHYKEDVYEGKVRDISGNGISFHCTEQWDVGEAIIIQFELAQKTFRYEAEILRKSEGTLGRPLYGCSFLNQTEKQKSEISAQLLRLEAKRRKN